MAGHIYIKGNLCKDNGTWVVRARVPDVATGEAKHRSKSTGLKVNGNNKHKAQEKMREIVAEWEKEANTGIKISRNPLFSECVEEWLKKKALDLRPNTLQAYQMNANTYIIPMLGHVKIGNLTRQHIQKYFEELNRRLSVNTMKKHRVIIRGVLEDAFLDGIVPANVADRVKLPKAKKFEGTALTEEQVGRLLDAVKHEPDYIQTAIILAVSYGLRRSEICGLRWCDIDFDSGQMYIRNTVTEYSGKVLEAETTKTKASNRSIPLIPETVLYFHSIYERQTSEGISSGKVCVHSNGKQVTPEYLSTAIKKILVKYGFNGIRPHDLRHTAATMLARRLPAKQVQAYLGHKDVSTTLNIYTHITDSDKVATSQAMGAILKSIGFCSDRCSDSDKS